MIAFNGDLSVKAGILQRIDAAYEAGRLTPFASSTSDVSTPLLKCVDQSGDAAIAASAIDCPEPLLRLWHLLGQSLFQHGAAEAFYTGSRRLIAETEAGADLELVPSSMAVWMLQHPRAGTADHAVARELLDLHLRDADGDRPARGEWAEARQKAMSAMDASRADKSSPAILWEAAAWSARSSRSVLGAVARAWMSLTVDKIDDPWTAADEARMKAAFEQVTAEREAGELKDDRRFPDIVEEREPELAARFKRHMAETGRVYNERAVPLADAMIAACKAAPVTLHAHGIDVI